MAEAPFGHEPSAIATPRVLGVAAILAFMVIIIVIVIRFAVGPWALPQHAQVVARSAPIPAPPRLQPHPDVDLAALRAQKQTLLSTWVWTGPTHDFARIPIERAMVLYAQQHAASSDARKGGSHPEESAP